MRCGHKMLAELHPQLDLAVKREVFLPIEPSTPTNDDVEDSIEDLEEGQL